MSNQRYCWYVGQTLFSLKCPIWTLVEPELVFSHNPENYSQFPRDTTGPMWHCIIGSHINIDFFGFRLGPRWGRGMVANPGPQSPRFNLHPSPMLWCPIPNCPLGTLTATHCSTWVHPRHDGLNAESQFMN